MWLSFGYSHESFWDQTDRTLLLTIKAQDEKSQREHNRMAWAVWHTVALGRMKKLPPLSRLLYRAKKAVSQTIEQQIAMARMWTAAMGGKIGKRRK